MQPSVMKNELCDRCGCKLDPETMLYYEYIALEYNTKITQDIFGSTTTTTTKYRNATPMKVLACKSCAAFLRKRHFLSVALVCVGIPLVLSFLLFFILDQIEIGVIVSIVFIFFSIICILALKKEIKNKFINPGTFDEDFKRLGVKKAAKLYNELSSLKSGSLRTKSKWRAGILTHSDFEKLEESSKALS